ncbi:MAG: hypothetical protein HY290_05985 [Planctomycetia bacterium]|nr:hypothetical protein [Planctomycetia bacterium]
MPAPIYPTCITEQLPNGILRIAFTGSGGVGSAGNPVGEQMEMAVEQVLSAHDPSALLIDFSQFEYQFGDWIGSAPLRAVRALGRNRVCLLATGPTGEALRSLLNACNLGQILPLVGSTDEALRYLSQR